MLGGLASPAALFLPPNSSAFPGGKDHTESPRQSAASTPQPYEPGVSDSLRLVLFEHVLLSFKYRPLFAHFRRTGEVASRVLWGILDPAPGKGVEKGEAESKIGNCAEGRCAQ